MRYFEGCLPCEVMAERGEKTLAFGPMKPVGLTDPRTGRRPHAVVQLRPEDAAATAYNLVGFQTRMKYGEQVRVFRMIPGLEQAEFLRLGSVHRNTFVNAPELLSSEMELKSAPGVHLAGQITGVEGYVESAAGGFLCAVLLAQRLRGETIRPPPPTTALGGILTHLSRPQPQLSAVEHHLGAHPAARRHRASASRSAIATKPWPSARSPISNRGASRSERSAREVAREPAVMALSES